MLCKFKLSAAVTVAALTCTAASAEQFRILIMDHAFFPEISYVTPGDEVIFVNMSGVTRDISADDASWLVAGLADGSEASLLISEGMPNVYKVLPTNEADTDEILGKLNFSVQQTGIEGN